MAYNHGKSTYKYHLVVDLPHDFNKDSNDNEADGRCEYDFYGIRGLSSNYFRNHKHSDASETNINPVIILKRKG